MKPRFVGRLGVADFVSAGNASLGFLAVAAAPIDVGLSARLILLAAVLDGLDGVLARRYGGTPSGQYLDSLADVSSFAIAPAVLVATVALQQWPLADGSPLAYAALVVPALFVAMAVIRLALYTAYDTRDHHTEGVPTTLAATILGAAALTAAGQPEVLLAGTAVFCYLMVSTVEYPDLLARDAITMGVVHALAVLFPAFYGKMFPWALLFLALAYLTLAPWFYWRDAEVDCEASPDAAPEPVEQTE